MPSDDGCRQRASKDGTCHNETTVIATPEEVLTGHPIGPHANGAVCSGCGEALHEADIVFAYAYRCAEAVNWTVSRLFCYGCAPSRIQSPTLGTTEIVVGGRIGTIGHPTPRTHRLCLTELAVRAISRSTEGSKP